MLTAIKFDNAAEHRRLRVAGVAFLGLIVALIATSIGIYTKAFETSTKVTVIADRAGLQLPKFGDVRMHGMIVGQVRNVSNNGTHAVIELAIDPDTAKAIPANVDVQIVPTTIFGQKYVQFVDPTGVREGSLSAGEVIQGDRVTTSVELETVLANLGPLLTTLKPAELNVTLHALSSALIGRGDQIGATMSQLNAYLGALNPRLPDMEADFAQLAKVAKAYGVAAPDLITILKNATTTANTVAQQRGELEGIFKDLTTLSVDSTVFLHDNGAGIIKEAAVARPLVTLLDRYSPEFTCLLQGLDRYTGRLDQIFAHSRVSQTMILSGTQQPAYTSGERPVYGDVGHGPWCVDLPVPPQGAPLPHYTFNDGTSKSRP